MLGVGSNRGTLVGACGGGPATGGPLALSTSGASSPLTAAAPCAHRQRKLATARSQSQVSRAAMCATRLNLLGVSCKLCMRHRPSPAER